MRVTHAQKLKPIRGEWKYYEGHRGNRWVIWALVDGQNPCSGRLKIAFAAGCRHCKQWWGWTRNRTKAARTAKAMSVKSCPRCKKRLSAKAYIRLQKALKKKK